MKTSHFILIMAGIITILAVAIVINHDTKLPPTQQNATFASKGIVLGVEGSVNASAMKFASNSGVKYFRYDIRMTPQQIQNISNLSSNGIQVLGILDYDTLGAAPFSSGCMGNCNWSLNDWNATVYNAITSYPEVHVWEIWNEPLNQQFESGLLKNGSAYNYYLMVKSAYTVIKQHNQSNDTVLCFGGGFLADPTEYNWYSEVWAYGLSQYCNGISLHAYTNFNYHFYLLNQTPFGSNEDVAQILNQSLGEYENLTSEPIWITEVGIPSNIGQPQTDFLNQTMGLFLTKSYVKGVFWYNLVGTSGGNDFGLLNATTLSPKPSWYAFKKFLNGTS